MNAPTVHIKDILIENDSSLGLVFGDNLHIGKEPSSPDECVTLFDVGSGQAPTITIGQNSSYFYTAIQVRVRSNSYDSGWNLIQDIFSVLHGKNNFSADDGTFYTLMTAAGEPSVLDWDDLDRVRFVCTINIQRR